MGKLRTLTVLISLIFSSLVPSPAVAATISVGNFSELQSALNSATDGDTIEFNANIIASSRLSTNKDLTIDGKGFLWSVTTPGLDEAGVPNPSPSNHGLITFQSGSTSTIRNVDMWGGSNVSSNLGAIRVDAGASLRITDSSIERSYTDTASRRGGGGIVNAGTTVLDRVKVRRNGAGYGGGFLNTGNLVIVNSTFSDNRSTSSSGGGGAGENASGGKLWIVNSTFANNLSTEIGSAINNYFGQFFVAQSTFVGNLGTSGFYACGAIGVNGGSGKVVSSLFAYNYEVISGAFALVDLGNTNTSWSGCRSANIEVDHSMLHSASSAGATTGWLAAKGAGNVSYSATADGQSNETLFSGGSLMRPTGGNGSQITSPSTQIFRPNLVFEGSMPIAKLKENNVTPGISSGVPIYFGENGGSTILAYWDQSASSWSVMSGSLPGSVTSSASANLLLDQVGIPYSSPAALGATELTTARTFSVVAVKQPGGSVTGASVYGDAFPANTRVEVSAVPDPGYRFSKWEVALESGSSLINVMNQQSNMRLRFLSSPIEVTANPISFAVTTNTTLRPIFVAATAGTHSITYAANGATSGSAPSATVETAGLSYSVLGNTGNLTRLGFTFAGWNTASNGSGATYNAGDSLVLGSNITLHARWSPVATINVSFLGNGSEGGSVPSSFIANVGSSFIVASNAGSLSRAGFTFSGWNTQPDGSGTTYQPGTPVTASTNLVLYALWSQNNVQLPAGPNVSTPISYTGPVIQSISPAAIYAGEEAEVAFSGQRLDLIKSIRAGTVLATEISFEQGKLVARFQPLVAGLFDLEIIYGSGARLTQLQALKVLPKRVIEQEAETRAPKVNAGSFNGVLAIYARAHAGKRLSVNVDGRWVVVNQVPPGALFRLIQPANSPVSRVSIYVDRKLIDTFDLQRR